MHRLSLRHLLMCRTILPWQGWTTTSIPDHQISTPYLTTSSTAMPPPSPRLRHDYLLLHKPPISARTALEAFATPGGVEAYKEFPNLVSRAETLLPGLRHFIKTLTSEFVAARVCMALDGVPLRAPIEADVPADLFGD